MVGDQVAGDGDQPGAEVAALPGEAADPLERAQEGVGGEVLGELPVADPEVDEPEHGVHVPVVDQAERLGLAGLGPLDQRPDLGRRRRTGPGRLGKPVGGGPARSVAGTAGSTAVSAPPGRRSPPVRRCRRPCAGMAAGRGTATRPPAGLPLPPGAAGRGGGSLWCGRLRVRSPRRRRARRRRVSSAGARAARPLVDVAAGRRPVRPAGPFRRNRRWSPRCRRPVGRRRAGRARRRPDRDPVGQDGHGSCRRAASPLEVLVQCAHRHGGLLGLRGVDSRQMG